MTGFGGKSAAFWQAKRLALKRRLAMAFGKAFDPYPPVPSGLSLSPSDRHRVGGPGAEKALDFSHAGLPDYAAWQQQARRKLIDLTGYGRFGGPPPANHVTDLPLRDGFRHRSLYVKVRDGHDLPLRIVWHPSVENETPAPVMICLQGTNSGMHLSWGEARMPADPIKIANGADFARQAAARGYIAVCLEQSCFGECREQKLDPPSPTPCIDAANHALLFGRCLVGERAGDVSAVVNWLTISETGFRIDHDRIYVMGSSSGGTTAMFAGALDERLAGVLAAGCVGYMRDTLLTRRDPEGQNIVPGILRWFEIDSVIALNAPRPFVTVSGDSDHIWPFRGADEVVRSVARVYEAMEAAGAVAAAKATGGHRFYPDIAWPAFDAALDAAGQAVPAPVTPPAS